MTFGMLLGHIVCKQGFLVDHAKIAVIINMPPQKIGPSVKSNIGTHRIVQEIYKRVCEDHWANGEIFKKRQQVSVE